MTQTESTISSRWYHPTPPYPKTERQARIIALAEEVGRIADRHAAEHDRDNTFPHETFRALHEAGYLTLTIPEEHGGWGASPLEVLLAQERLAQGDGSVALGVTMHLTSTAGIFESDRWPIDLRDRVIADVIQNGALINGVASEPELGSPSRGGGYRTTAKRVDGGWLINGRKTWSTLSPALTYANVLLAVEEEDGTLIRGNFLVPTTTPGVRIDFTWDNLGMRATGSHDLIFDNVFVTDDFRLPASQAVPASQVNGWSLLTSAVYLGIAQAARNFAVTYAQHRVPSGVGKPIAELQNVQHRIAQIDILLLQARSLLYSTIETWENFPDHRDRIAWHFAATKYTVTNNAIQVTDQALRVVGSVGLQKQHPLERYFRDVRAGLGNPPMDDVALTTIGKHALGIS